MICTNCGSPIEGFNKFCPKCGTIAPVRYQQPPAASSSPYSSPQAPMYSGPGAQPPRKSSCGKIILIVGVILVLLLAGIAAAVYFGYGALEKKLKSSEAYTMAVAALKENAEVKEKLGDIQETGFPIGAFDQNSNGSGNAAFSMSVQGTKGSGQYQVSLKRTDFKWHVETAFVRTTSGEIIRIAGGPEFDLDSNSNNSADQPAGEEKLPAGTISGGVMNDKAISLPTPAYPAIAKQAKASGKVVVQVLVDEKGNVVSALPVSGHPLLRAAAAAAARGAKFPPKTVAGKAVKVSGTLTYDFKPE